MNMDETPAAKPLDQDSEASAKTGAQAAPLTEPGSAAMKLITMTHLNAINHVTFLKGEMADAAYTLIKKALREYREFGNDKDAAISFATETGEQTLALRTLQAVGISDLDLDEELATGIFERDARVKARRLAIYAAQGIVTEGGDASAAPGASDGERVEPGSPKANAPIPKPKSDGAS